MNINLFGYDLLVKDTSCGLNGECVGRKIEEPHINIYVRIENRCNANCPFCSFKGEKVDFDFYKFYYILHEVSKKIKINKISFTGGEPTLNYVQLMDCLSLIKQFNSKIFTVVNTNGLRLQDLSMCLDIDSIALSRHHYDQNKNDEIFGIKTPTLQNIKEWNQNKNIHLSCNLIKGYIDNENELTEYLQTVSQYGIDDVGFVSLMEVNDFCKNHKIDFADVKFTNPDILITKDWNYKDVCKCRNHLYLSDKGDIVKFYSRYTTKPSKSEGMLVFDGNVLKDGFTGPIIL